MEQTENTGLYSRLMEYLKERMLFADELAPALLSSIGGHIANIYHQKEPFVFKRGIPEDTLKIYVAIIAPTRLSKSYAMKLLISKRYGFVPVLSKFRGKITEAKFTGTRAPNGDIVYGDAYTYREGILVFNEISNLFEAQKQLHSSELINQVMESYSENHVNKGLGLVEIDYDTSITIWGATQFSRFDFSQGLAPRFLFVAKKWEQADFEALKKLRLEDDENGKGDYESVKGEVEKLRTELNNLKQQFSVKQVRWNKDMLLYLYGKTDSHWQMQNMERVLIGKETLDGGLGEILRIQNTDENKRIVDLLLDYQRKVSFGAEYALLLDLMTADKEYRLRDLWNTYRKFGYTFTKFYSLLQTALKDGLIHAEMRAFKDAAANKSWQEFVYKSRCIQF